jgi:hypothetical protein
MQMKKMTGSRKRSLLLSIDNKGGHVGECW